MTQTLPPEAAAGGPMSADYEVGSTAAGRRPVTMYVDGERVYGTFYEPSPAAARGQRVGVLVAEQFGWHRMHHRLAQRLAGAGYYVLTYDFRGRGESEGGDATEMWQRHHVPASMVADTRQAVATFRALVPLDRLVGYAYCQAGHVLARCAVDGRFDGLVFAGATTIDQYFRENYKGVLSGLPNLAEIGDLDLFPALEEYDGPLLFIHGDGDLFLAASPLEHLVARAERWSQLAAGRTYELGTIQNADHTFSSSPHESIVIDLTVQWVERHFGPGYPLAWQGPPPSSDPPPPRRADGVEAQVPLLATGAQVGPATDGAPVGNQPAWRLALPDGRQFALTDALRKLVALVDGHRPVAQIAEQLSAEMGRAITPEQVAKLLRERLAPLGVVEPDARGEGGEAESGMTDILIRCYEPHDRLRALLDNLTRVTRSPYNVILVVGKRHAARNQNLALDRALTRYAVFLDDDVILTEGWLERLRETMDRTGAGAVSGRQLGMDGRALYSSAGCPEGAIVEAPIGGTCFMFRTDLGLRFDESYVRSQWDDVDFMFELYDRGYKTYVDGRVPFYHFAEGKIWLNQNFFHFEQKWKERRRLLGWYRYRYANGHIVTLLPSYGAAEGAPLG